MVDDARDRAGKAKHEGKRKRAGMEILDAEEALRNATQRRSEFRKRCSLQLLECGACGTVARNAPWGL
jgi:hypothetical protein